jgi:hypothetical protein
MPELTVKALGEMIHLPLYEQMRILAEQKYPRQIPAMFRVPFYGPALVAIREYYRRGNDLGVVDAAVAQIERGDGIPAKIAHNVAVLQAFRGGRQRQRVLTPRPGSRSVVDLSGLDVKFTPDLVADEGGRRKYVLYNFRAVDPTPEVARTILELACHVASNAGLECQARDLEFVSIRSDRVHRIAQIRRGTLNRARQNARAILQLWPAI